MNKEYNEQELIQNVINGDTDAFRKLYFYWFPFLCTHIFRITESKELTEEIVQDVFLKIWTHRETLNNISSFKAYLIVISRNYALNFLRKLSREKIQFIKWQKEAGLAVLQADSEQEESHLSLIDEAITKLPNRQQEIYLMHRHDRLTYYEIAEKLSIGRETVKTHLKLAVTSISAYVRTRINPVFLLLAILLNKIS